MVNNPNTGKVLVLGSDTRSFLSVIRSLGRKKLEVHIAWYGPESPAYYSCYINKVHVIDKYDQSNNKWLGQLIEILEAEDYDLRSGPC